MSRPSFAPLARTAGHRRLVAAAQRTIAALLDVSAAPYAAFSGGKDSSVLLHLARGLAPGLPAIYGDDEWLLPETAAILDATPGLLRIPMRVRHAEWFEAHADDGTEAAAPTWAADLGYDGALVGLRADESVGRRRLLAARGPLFHNARRGLWQCCPLRDWSARDIWTYIQAYDVPYNAAYDVLDRLGVPLEQQRIGPFAVERVLGRGQLAILKAGWPDLFNQFAARYPEARAYV